MEKHRPHYKLEIVKELLNDPNRVVITFTAAQTAYALGFYTKLEILSVISSLNRENFYKSMTSNRNHKEWQDVYKYYHSELKID